MFRTNFRMDFPFDLAELLVYAAMGAACGVLGAAFVYLHKRIVLFNRKHKRMSAFLQRNRFLYPLIITTLISSVTFPPFLGKYMASEVRTIHFTNFLFKVRSPYYNYAVRHIQELPIEWITQKVKYQLWIGSIKCPWGRILTHRVCVLWQPRSFF